MCLIQFNGKRKNPKDRPSIRSKPSIRSRPRKITVPTMSRTAYFDCLSGISGDMTLGALVDLGADVTAVEAAVRSLGLPELSITARTVKKCGFRAIKVDISHPPEHAHRHLHHITEMIERAEELTDSAKDLARRIFTRLAEAEANVHDSTLEKVHFHEVGAIDSIADIVGSAVAMDLLGIETVAASAVPTGGGTVSIAHGRVSIPAPATAELLRGVPLAPSDITAELTTPTGAAILRATASSFGPLPPMQLHSVGYGAGTKDFDDQPNVLRVLLGDTSTPEAAPPGIESDLVVVLETNIDDSTPEQLADCVDRLFSRGALDVFQIPCVMKKGRSGVLLSVITSTSRVGLMEQVIFEHSTSIGIRRYPADRHKLPRKAVTVETKFGPVRGKLILLPNGSPRFSVEDTDAREVAASAGVSAQVVREAAWEAWRQL